MSARVRTGETVCRQSIFLNASTQASFAPAFLLRLPASLPFTAVRASFGEDLEAPSRKRSKATFLKLDALCLPGRENQVFQQVHTFLQSQLVPCSHWASLTKAFVQDQSWARSVLRVVQIRTAHIAKCDDGPPSVL